MAADSNVATKDDLVALHTSLSADIHALGVRFERLESYMQGIAEGLTSTREQLERRIDAVEEHLSARFDLLEEVVTQSSNDIRKNSEDILALRSEVADLRRQLVRREKLDELDVRITTLEKRVGIKS